MWVSFPPYNICLQECVRLCVCESDCIMHSLCLGVGGNFV